MRTVFSFLLLIILLAALTARADDVVSHWTDHKIKIDGKADDWPSLAGMILKDENAAVAVANDDSSLYFIFRTTDERWVRAISMSGITLYLDIDGGKHKDFYLKFTGGPPPEMMRRNMEGRQTEEIPGNYRGMEEPRREREHRGSQLMLYIKDRLSEKDIPLDGAQGPAAAFDTSLGFYTYEFRVPLDYGKPLDFGLGVKRDKKIGIGLVWGDMEGMMKRERPDGGGLGGMGDGGFPGGGMEPGGGRPMGGGGKGDRDGPPGGRRGQMLSKQEVWFKTKLTTVEG